MTHFWVPYHNSISCKTQAVFISHRGINWQKNSWSRINLSKYSVTTCYSMRSFAKRPCDFSSCALNQKPLLVYIHLMHTALYKVSKLLWRFPHQFERKKMSIFEQFWVEICLKKLCLQDSKSWPNLVMSPSWNFPARVELWRSRAEPSRAGAL